MSEEHQTQHSGSTITIKKTDIWKYSTFLLIAVVVIGAVIMFSGGSPGTGAAVNTGGDTLPSTGSQVNVQIEDNDPVLGDPDAPVSVVEFSDFECPFCGRAYFDAVADLKQSSYFTNGEVNFIYKHFPLTSIHPRAQPSAEASLCADEQGMFWEYHDMLFENQASLDDASLKSYASQLGLDTNEFNDCLDSGEYGGEVSKELAQATAAGGRGTPYFVVINTETGDTQAVSGAVPFANLEAAINAVL